MIVLNSLQDFNKYFNSDSTKSFAITIGNFDGLHLGHRDFLKKSREECHAKKMLLCLVTFNPHPKFVLNSQEHFLINTYDERRALLHGLVDFVVEIPFTRDLSTKSPKEFLDQYIYINSNVKKIFLGHDFAFGANKSGDHLFVKKYCEDHHLEFEIQDEFKLDNQSVSSTEIRKLILEGNMKVANLMLGRPFFIRGNVIKGAGRGRQIGFPTANLSFDRQVIAPAKGVYKTMTKIHERIFKSITNVGKNPTFTDSDIQNVETNIFDFNEDIYGETIEIIFESYIRPEKKFSSVGELVEQIQKDIIYAKSN